MRTVLTTQVGVGAGTGTNYGSVDSITSAGADLVIAGADSTKAGLSDATATASTKYVECDDCKRSWFSYNSGLMLPLNAVNSARGTLGAIQNRFESVVTSLQTSAESLSAARSRIQDAGLCTRNG